MCNSNSLWGDNWLWWIILIIILIWVCGGQNGCCNDGNSCCGTGCCGCLQKKAALSGKGRRRFHVCGKPAENAGFVALGKKSGKIQISSCQRGRSVVF